MVPRQESQHQGRRQQLRRAWYFVLRLHQCGQLLRITPVLSRALEETNEEIFLLSGYVGVSILGGNESHRLRNQLEVDVGEGRQTGYNVLYPTGLYGSGDKRTVKCRASFGGGILGTGAIGFVIKTIVSEWITPIWCGLV